MARKTSKRIVFPLGGLDRRQSFRQQKPYTTFDCMNVRPTGQLESRERGGSRPGLLLSHRDYLDSEVRFLNSMVLAPGTGLTSWSDTFGGTSLAAVWSKASWATDTLSILTSMAAIDYSISDGAVVRDTLSPAIDTSYVYTVEILLVPWSGAFHGKYRLYLRLDDTTPLYTADGVEIEITMTGISGAYTGTVKSYIGSAEDVSTTVTSGTLAGAATQAVWLIAQITNDNLIVYLDGTTILNTTALDGGQNGLRIGFGLETTESGGVNLVNVFRIQYRSGGTVTPLRSTLIASAGGFIWREPYYGRMGKATSDLTVRDDVSLSATQSGQVLYVADYGDLRATAENGTVSGSELDSISVADWRTLGILTDDDVCVITNIGSSTVAGTYKISSVAEGAITLASAPGNGTCSFRIERAPKTFTPSTDTVAIMTASTGQVPTGCPLIARYLDRIVLAGAEIAPGVWYMARVGDELDWDYSQEDSKRAVAGTASDAGVPAKAITALAPASDDYLIIACRESLWRMRGDPAFGGSLDNLSNNIGIVGMNAWTFGPESELVFLSLDGLYVLPPGGDSRPISLSREILPRELLNFDPDNTVVCLEYDVQDRGVHIFLTERSSNSRTHWWLDWERKTFWPLQMMSDHEPTATVNLQATAIEDSGVICGGRDGGLRKFSFLSESDMGSTPASHIFIGPIPLAQDGQFGTIVSMDAVIAENVGDVTWAVHPGNTFEGATSASSVSTGTWVAGLNGTVRPGGRGAAFMLKLTGTAGRRWAMEQILVTMRDSGIRRIA